MTAMENVDRTQHLGGSDLAAILGIDRFRTPLDVYLEKRGEGAPVEETEAMFWGKDLEDRICRRWATRNNRKIRRRNARIVHPKHPWLGGHIDRDVVGVREGLEAKLSSADDWGPDGSADIPEHYVPQPHVYMAVTGYDRWHVTALLWSFGPPNQKDYVIERDEEMIGMLIEAGGRFMVDNVRKGVPPDPTSSEQANQLWNKAVVGRTTPITPDVLKAMGELVTEKEVQKASNARRDALELILKSHLQDSEVSVDEAAKALFSWKSQGSNRFDQKRFQEDHPELFAEYVGRTSYRVLRILKRGKEAAAMVTKELTDAPENEA